jgi:hypothetical protein
VGLDLGQPDRRVGDQLIEVLDDHGLGQHGQLVKWMIGAAGVEAPVERRTGIGVVAQLPQGPGLVGLQLLGGPVVALAQPVPVAQDAQDHSQVAAPQSVFTLGVEDAARRLGALRVSGHGRLVVS